MKKRQNEPVASLFLVTFLFLPRSTYMLEHVYLDPVIFMFFLLSVYMFLSKRENWFLFFLSLFISMRQNLLLIFPFYLTGKVFKRLTSPRKLFAVLVPFTLIGVFLLLDPQDFLADTMLSLSTGKITSPIHISLTLPAFLNMFVFKAKASASYLLGYLLFALSYFLLLRSKLKVNDKIVALLFFFNFFLYHAFFSSYYLVALFLFFSIFADYFEVSNDYVESKRI